MGGGIAFGISGSASASGPLHTDDVFSTYVYEASGSTQAINNGIDLNGKGGMVWIKNRLNGGTYTNNTIVDSERIGTHGHKSVYPNLTDGQFNPPTSGEAVVTTFSSNGFTRGGNANVTNGDNVAWSFRKAPGFFDIVTYTSQNGVTAIDHNLGSVPGCIMVKKTNDAGSWQVYHRYTGAGSEFELDGTDGTRTNGAFPTAPTDTQFFISASNNNVFGSVGDQFVAYIFAHDESTFGLNSDKPIIRCGDFTSNGSSVGTIDLGFEPQWVLVKQYTGAGGDWYIFDQMRGFHTTAVGNTGADINILRANSNAGEGDYNYLFLNTNGFSWDGNSIGSHSFIYVAVGRLPKPPTSAADVFKVYKQSTGTAAQGDVNYGITADLVLFKKYNSNSNNNLPIWVDRVRGENNRLDSTSPSAQYTDDGAVDFDRQHGITINSDASSLTSNGFSYRHYVWKRAAKFFDIVTWLGTGTVTTFPHNLQIKPEMIIVKNITYSSGTNWMVWHKDIGDTLLNLNSDGAWLNSGPSSTYGGTGSGTTTGAEFITNSTDSVIGLASAFPVNGSGHRYISYLFASLDGVSKVGSYTGQASGSYVADTLGFTPKFIMIKAADRAGDWNVFDVERGLTVGGTSAVAVALNTTDNETQTNETDAIRATTTGFTVNTGSASTDINENGKKYLYYAIA